ncbi:MAG: hypothetical protein EZS28_051042, partial [Streblomastix strix]
ATTTLNNVTFSPTHFGDSPAIRLVFPKQTDPPIMTNFDGGSILGMTRETGIGAAIEAEFANLDIKNTRLAFDPPASNIKSNSHSNKHKTTKKRWEENEGEGEADPDAPPEPPLFVATCGWSTAYVRAVDTNIAIRSGTQFTNIQDGALSLRRSAVIIDKDASNVFVTNTFPNPEVAETALRRNIACGGGSSVAGPLGAFSEGGAQGNSLWIYRTDEGTDPFPEPLPEAFVPVPEPDPEATPEGTPPASNKIQTKGKGSQKSNDLEPECSITIDEKAISAALFVPVLEDAEGDISPDKYGVDVVFKGKQFVICGLTKYEICENIDVNDADGNPIAEKV